MKNRLAVLRAAARWSQAELAERVGVSRQSIVSIERGKYDPSLPLAFRIAPADGQLDRRLDGLLATVKRQFPEWRGRILFSVSESQIGSNRESGGSSEEVST